MDPAVRRALRQLTRTIKEIEPEYRRALEQQDYDWFDGNFVSVTTLIIKRIARLAELAGNASEGDLAALEPVLNTSCLFMAQLASMVGDETTKRRMLGLVR